MSADALELQIRKSEECTISDEREAWMDERRSAADAGPQVEGRGMQNWKCDLSLLRSTQSPSSPSLSHSPADCTLCESGSRAQTCRQANHPNRLSAKRSPGEKLSKRSQAERERERSGCLSCRRRRRRVLPARESVRGLFVSRLIYPFAPSPSSSLSLSSSHPRTSTDDPRSPVTPALPAAGLLVLSFVANIPR